MKITHALKNVHLVDDHSLDPMSYEALALDTAPSPIYSQIKATYWTNLKDTPSIEHVYTALDTCRRALSDEALPPEMARAWKTVIDTTWKSGGVCFPVSGMGNEDSACKSLATLGNGLTWLSRNGFIEKLPGLDDAEPAQSHYIPCPEAALAYLIHKTSGDDYIGEIAYLAAAGARGRVALPLVELLIENEPDLRPVLMCANSVRNKGKSLIVATGFPSRFLAAASVEKRSLTAYFPAPLKAFLYPEDSSADPALLKLRARYRKIKFRFYQQ